MWIAHFAPAFARKTVSPNVPLWVLALAGSIPDAAFFVNAILGIESFRYNTTLEARGCFPYSNDYPYSHSLVGVLALSIAVTAWYSSVAKPKASPLDLASVMAAGLSHYFLELPSHRKDITLTPGSPQPHGIEHSLFDTPTALLLVEVGIVAASLIPTSKIQFCFLGAPTHETRWIHAPMFLTTVLSTLYGLKWLDESRQYRVQPAQLNADLTKEVAFDSSTSAQN
ncbi:hypothetical protein DL93DRAFT_2227199 [Clavulina sp. PMI_390]|nr:hypothetical protein DL93DRAFT_2227199 [Clavulina sp. PMI_390]